MEARRVMVYGVTGSGKSTLAARLGEITGVPAIAVDDLTWRPGWEPVPAEEQREIIAEVCAADSWVLDHGYGGWLDIVLERVELIIALDYPRWLSLGRLLRRSVGNVVFRRPTCNGNTETLRTSVASDSILVWHFRSFGRKHRRMQAWQRDGIGPEVLLFRHPKQVEAWLESQQAGSVRV